LRLPVVCVALLSGVVGAQFRHPGVLVSKDLLDGVRDQVSQGLDPAFSAFVAANTSSFAALDYKPTPRPIVECGSYSHPDHGCSDEKRDASAAYTHALLAWVTPDAGLRAIHWQLACNILNSWSAVLQGHNNSNAPLQSAWVASTAVRAAEIVRALGSTTTQSVCAFNEIQYKGMLKRAYLPEVIHGSHSNGNWELSMAEATVAMGVFLDDDTVFQQGLALWRGRVPAYFYLTSDGPLPHPQPGEHPSKSTLEKYWYDQHKFVDGLCQETCRDLGHVQYGFAAMINAAETALCQGVDLFTEEQGRILPAIDFHANFLLGGAVPSWLCGGSLKSDGPKPTWEIALRTYASRGLPMNELKQLVEKIRPTGVDHHMDWETLTHGIVLNSTFKAKASVAGGWEK